MYEKAVIKGGSKVLDQSTLEGEASLLLHSFTKDRALVKGRAIIKRSTIGGNALVAGCATVEDAYVGGNARLTIEQIGRHGHVTAPEHAVLLRVRGETFTVHRTYSPAKGYSAQVVHHDHGKITVSQIRDLIHQHDAFRVVLTSLNLMRREVSTTNNEEGNL